MSDAHPEQINVDFTFRSAPETCTHEGHIVQVDLMVCGEQIDQVCTRCGVAL